MFLESKYVLMYVDSYTPVQTRTRFLTGGRWKRTSINVRWINIQRTHLK
jgi:hypothetical protein